MDLRDAQSLIAEAVPRELGVWADLGAGEGTFTRALAGLLAPGSRIYAVDRDEASLSWVRGESINGVEIHAVVDDYARNFDMNESRELLDGMLFANSLHFVKEQAMVLARLAAFLRPGGRVVLVEYDRRAANQWVPHPIPITALPTLARTTGLNAPRILASRPSRYQGTIYSAIMKKSES